MKTKIFYFMAFFAFATLTMNAQTAVAITEVKVPVQDNRVEITVDQLPEPVLKTLKTDAYKDWSISKAYHIKGTGERDMQKEHYEVVLKLNDRETTLKLDKDGNVIE